MKLCDTISLCVIIVLFVIKILVRLTRDGKKKEVTFFIIAKYNVYMLQKYRNYREHCKAGKKGLPQFFNKTV